MLTKDENMINAKFAVQYKINDAQKYLFNVANPKLTLRQVVESAKMPLALAPAVAHLSY
jgi:membrane protease subunit HflK